MAKVGRQCLTTPFSIRRSRFLLNSSTIGSVTSWSGAGWQVSPRIEELLAQVSTDQQRDLFIALLRVELEYCLAAARRRISVAFSQFAILIDRLLHDPAGDTADLGPELLANPTPPSVEGLEILGMIAAGGMGIVYRAWEAARTFGRDQDNEVRRCEWPRLLERFQREAWAVARRTQG